MPTSEVLKWDQDGDRLYELGTDRGVIYPRKGTGYDKGVAWNGLTAVTESPSGAEETALWADNIKYGSMRSAEEFGATIEAYTYPDEFAICDGSVEPVPGMTIGQQNRVPFGFSYRTLIGNDTEAQDHGYKIHVLYGCTVTPSEKAYTTINDSPEAITFSWEMTSQQVDVTGYKPTACLTFDSTKLKEEQLLLLEAVLYGTADEESLGENKSTYTENPGPRLPSPDEIVKLLKDAKPIDHRTPVELQITSVTAASGSVLDKTGTDLYTGLSLSEGLPNGNITATEVKKISDAWTSFDADNNNTGYFIALKVEATEGATVSAEITAEGTSASAVKAKDAGSGLWVFRLAADTASSDTDLNQATITFTATKSADEQHTYTNATKVYKTTGVKKAAEE